MRIRRRAPRSWGWYQVPAHLHHFTPRALRRLVEAAGLTVEIEETCGGDSLFCALTAWHGIGLDSSTRTAARAHRLTRWMLSVLGHVLRPYYQLGDDELVRIGETVSEGLRPYWDVDPDAPDAAGLEHPTIRDFFFVARGRQVFTGLRSHDDLRAHFGLGNAARVERLEVQWPSGVRETLTDVAPGRVVTVVEGKGLATVARPGH